MLQLSDYGGEGLHVCLLRSKWCQNNERFIPIQFCRKKVSCDLFSFCNAFKSQFKVFGRLGEYGGAISASFFIGCHIPASPMNAAVMVWLAGSNERLTPILFPEWVKAET